MTDLHEIELLICDVDGVLTDGRIIYGPDGLELKSFDVKDGAGLKYWKRAGGKLAWITGRQSEIVIRRAGELGVDALRQDAKIKLPAFESVLAELGCDAKRTAVIGDDLPDLPLLREAGFSACPADAVAEVRDAADYVCRTPGGRGCVRELVEHLLQQAGRWDEIMARYRPQGSERTD